jgi:hypothetical protein
MISQAKYIVFVAVAIVIVIASSAYRKQGNSYEAQRSALVKKWQGEEFVSIEKTESFSELVRAIPLELQTQVDPEAVRCLRQSAIEFMHIMKSGSHDDYIKYVTERGSNGFQSEPMARHAKAAKVTYNSDPEGFRALWQHTYPDAAGYWAAISPSNSSIHITESVTTDAMSLARDYAQTVAEESWGTGCGPSFVAFPSESSSGTYQYALFETIVKHRTEAPAYPYAVLFRYQQNTKVWVPVAGAFRLVGEPNVKWIF